MNEAEWLACTDPKLLVQPLGLRSERKVRLLGCACCRRIWHRFDAEVARAAIEVSERYADGNATLLELVNAASNALRHKFICDREKKSDGGAYLAYQATDQWVEGPPDSGFADDRPAQCEIVRDIFGNPFRPVAAKPAWLIWLSWHNNMVPQLARSIYDERRFADMPALADALEEAGCREIEILQHCRQAGEHVRGCWVVDLLLGKV